MSYYIGIVSESRQKVESNFIEDAFSKVLELKEAFEDQDLDSVTYLVIKGEDPSRNLFLEYAEKKGYKSIVIDNPHNVPLDEVSEGLAYRLVTSESFEKNTEDFRKNVDIVLFFGKTIPVFVRKNLINQSIPVIKIG